MLRSLCLPLLGLALLTHSAVAQKAPAKKPTHTAKHTPHAAGAGNKPAAHHADPLSGTNDGGRGQSGYTAPGMPTTPPDANGKNTPPYDGPAAPAKRNATLSTPK